MDSSTKAGTFTGTVLVLLFKVNSAELLTTAVLAAVGAVVSFGVSVVLKYIADRIKNK